MPAWAITNGLLCALMLLFAACAPETERRLAVEQVVVLFGVWLLYVASWFPSVAPAFVVWRLTGQSLDPSVFWCAADCASGMWIAFRAGHHLWGAALFGFQLAMVLLHLVHRWAGTPAHSYQSGLDVLFWAEIAVFLLLGGRGVGNRIADLARVRRAHVGADRPAYSGEEA